jgi:heme/copper-type cytochrome/quinol oxidase subunit 2
MSGEAIITIIALAVILVVFGIPLYVVRRHNRNQDVWPDQEQPGAEIAPVNDAAPQLTQEPAITSDTIAVNPVPVMNPVPSVNPVRKRAEKKATVVPSTEKKTARRSKPKSGNPGKAPKKSLTETAGVDKNTPDISSGLAAKLDEKKSKSTKKTTKSVKTVKKAAPKSKKSK